MLCRIDQVLLAAAGKGPPSTCLAFVHDRRVQRSCAGTT